MIETKIKDYHLKETNKQNPLENHIILHKSRTYFSSLKENSF